MPNAETTRTPAQQRVVDELLSPGAPRPTFEPTLAAELQAELEEGLRPVVESRAVAELTVTKHQLAEVLRCERRFLGEEAVPFDWDLRKVRGTVAHKAIELGLFAPDDPAPIELTDRAVQRLVERDISASTFLRRLDAGEHAELRAEVSDVVTRFGECFPPFGRRWLPRTESPSQAWLLDRRVLLKAKFDLVLGRPRGTEARVLIVDLKTGSPHPFHAEDLRYYALVETLRAGVPPFRVASYYLEAARPHCEDVTVDTLRSAVRRVVDGVRRLVELRFDGRPPGEAPGPACARCAARDGCGAAAAWAAGGDP